MRLKKPSSPPSVWDVLNSKVVVVVLGGLVLQLLAAGVHTATRERELAVAAAQERERMSVELRKEILHDRDQSARMPFETASKLVTASEDLMRVDEKAWRLLRYDPEDQKVVTAYENKLREDYNSAEGAWDNLKYAFEPMFGAIDANDRAPLAWHATRAAADHLEDCIADWFTKPRPASPPVLHPCHPAADATREALSQLSVAIAVSKRRLVDELRDPRSKK